MKLLVIGHSVVDRINYKGSEALRPGGIHYSIAALKNIAESEDEIFLCSAVSKKDEWLFNEVYNRINNNHIYYVDDIPQVNLTIYDDSERDERYCSISENLRIPMEELNNFDGILINMITGFDLTINQMKEVRETFKGLIYFDVHTFSRGIDENMKRYFRRIPDFDKWARSIDILQVSDEEIKTISGETDEYEIAYRMFSYGIKILIVTKNKSGARVYFKRDDKIESAHIPAVKVKSVNYVGCGDVFGAAFFYNYIRNRDIIGSLRFANTVAGISTTYSQTEDFNNLKRDVLQRYS
jgi:sugar/nucleoside kinase (ribokinase family)